MIFSSTLEGFPHNLVSIYYVVGSLCASILIYRLVGSKILIRLLGINFVIFLICTNKIRTFWNSQQERDPPPFLQNGEPIKLALIQSPFLVVI